MTLNQEVIRPSGFFMSIYRKRYMLTSVTVAHALLKYLKISFHFHCICLDRIYFDVKCGDTTAPAKQTDTKSNVPV